ncbi:MAG: ribonuclease III [Flavobacteriales bacterium]|nr:ribonuclease III [Flavobacteriales bacterium]
MIFIKKLIKTIPSLNKNREGIFIFLKKEFNIKIKNTKLYKTAFTHSSKNNLDNYERLEFLGDSILNSVVSEHLFLNHTKKDEGYLSKKRSIIVGRKNLNKIGKEILPKEQIQHKLHTITPNIYGNILESIIGAVYLDLGYNNTKEFIVTHIIKNTKSDKPENDYKSKILEWSQQNNKKIKFVNINQKGPDHKKEYLIQLFVDEKNISEAWGKTIKSAEQKSSEIAYKIVS